MDKFFRWFFVSNVTYFRLWAERRIRIRIAICSFSFYAYFTLGITFSGTWRETYIGQCRAKLKLFFQRENSPTLVISYSSKFLGSFRVNKKNRKTRVLLVFLIQWFANPLCAMKIIIYSYSSSKTLLQRLWMYYNTRYIE